MIIDRYIIREIIKPMTAICGVLILIFACYTAARYLSDAVQGLLPGDVILFLLLLKVLIALEVLLPTTLYLSVIIALGRLYKDSEMTALFACGVGIIRLLKPVFWLSLFVAVLVGSLSIFVRPWAYGRMYELRAHAKASFDIDRMRGGDFYEIENGNRVIFAERVDPQRQQAKRLFILTRRGDTLQVIRAKRADQLLDAATDKEIMVFTDGVLYEFSRFGKDGRIVEFKQSAMSLEPKENIPIKYKIKAFSTRHLANSNSLEEIAEFQWRISTPLSTILLALVGVFLSRSSPRRGKYAKVTSAVLIFAIYYNLEAVAKKWVEQGVVGDIPGIWWVQMLLVCLLMGLFWRQVPLLRWRTRS